MQRVVEIPDYDTLMTYLRQECFYWNPTPENVTIKPYGYDERIDWNTHIVCIDGKAALFTDGQLDAPLVHENMTATEVMKRMREYKGPGT